jgi:long-chain acyl-CoA synthetase
VALEPNAGVTTGELRDYVKSQIAAYKYPRVLWCVDELPNGPTGKILKREMRVPVGDKSGS